MPLLIKNCFINEKQECYDKVKEIILKKVDLIYNLGKYITETQHENNFFDDHLITTGVYIYQSYNNPNIGYRIYKEFANQGFNGYNDEKIIQQLQEKQQKIHLTTFPTGVVTLDNKIIGQEIPYYYDSMTLYEYFKKYNVSNPFQIYLVILDALKELYDEQILYLDVHYKNFMINPTNLKINIIDFDEVYLKFEYYKTYIESMFLNLKKMIDSLNKMSNISDDIVFLQTDNFEDSFYQVKQMQKKIKHM